LDCIGGLRLQHQVRQIQQGIAPDNLLLLADLSSEERHHLKAMFKVVAGLQEAMFRHYCVN
jgi:CBS domain-containing protein